MAKPEPQERRSFWARLFPPEHDFYRTLQEQADKVLEGVEVLVEWLYSGRQDKAQRVREIENEADLIRRRLANALGQAFSTPIDREDLHHLSRSLDEVMNYTRDIVREMEIFGIAPDIPMQDMGDLLLEGMMALRAGFAKMEKEPQAAIAHAQEAQRAENRLEGRYRQGVKALLEQDDLREILMRREVYRHISNTADRIDGCAEALWFTLVKYH
jgi:uncharacterized protein Yka (UPF0111/DUF47 family)